MRVLVYEFVTGGGLWLDADHGGSAEIVSGFASLLAEGRAMVAALLRDLTSLRLARPVCFQDSRYPYPVPAGTRVVRIATARQRREQLAAWAARVDGVIVIAPELDGHLLNDCHLVEQHSGTLWSPGPDFVALASDKTKTSDSLIRAGVACPEGVTLAAGRPMPADFPYPAVVKRVDGAGSTDTRIVFEPDADAMPAVGPPFRLERFQPGLPVSVAALCGPDGPVLLPACGQTISEDGRFRYLGGYLPLQPVLADRASKLARLALAALPATRGYIGVDMVLGAEPEGEADVVLDVNPRLTTSYVGLCQAAECNLTDAMLQVAQGRRPSEPLRFDSEPIRFDCKGQVPGGQ